MYYDVSLVVLHENINTGAECGRTVKNSMIIFASILILCMVYFDQLQNNSYYSDATILIYTLGQAILLALQTYW